MKNTILSLLATASLASGATTISNISNTTNVNIVGNDLLANQPDVAFNNDTETVQFTNGDFFRMQGFGDRVELQSLSLKDWFFDNKVIYPYELELADLQNIQQSNILTVTATAHHNNSQQFNVDIVKYMGNNGLRLRVLNAYAIPEPSTMLLGGIGMLLLLRRKRS